MRHDSSLTAPQRAAALALFAEGHGSTAVATRLGVSYHAVKRLYGLWRLRGDDALMTRVTKQTYSFETKCAVVQRFLAGETKGALAREFGVASPGTVATWVRIYRQEGADGLRPRPRGRPAPVPDEALSELDQLRRENQRLRAENAYLGKLRALRTTEPT